MLSHKPALLLAMCLCSLLPLRAQAQAPDFTPAIPPAIDYGGLIAAGSAFIGWKSPLGPADLGYGRSDSDESSLYLFLGVTF